MAFILRGEDGRKAAESGNVTVKTLVIYKFAFPTKHF
jgi:hypothetical protein